MAARGIACCSKCGTCRIVMQVPGFKLPACSRVTSNSEVMIQDRLLAGQKSASRTSSIDFPEARFWIVSGLPTIRPEPSRRLVRSGCALGTAREKREQEILLLSQPRHLSIIAPQSDTGA